MGSGTISPCADQEWKTWARSSRRTCSSEVVVVDSVSVIGIPWYAGVFRTVGRVGSARAREPEVDARGRRVGPSLRDDLAAGIEADALGTVHVGVAEEG